MHRDRGLPQCGVDPEQRAAIVRVVGIATAMSPHVFVEAALDPLMDAVDRARGGERLVEASPDHREHLAEGALEAPVGIVAGPRVVRDRLRHLGVRDLEQRGAAAAEEHAGMAVHAPEGGVGAEQAGHRVRSLGGQASQASLEVRRCDGRLPLQNHGSSVFAPAVACRFHSPGGPTMRFSYWPSPTQPWSEVLHLAQHVERKGYYGVWYADHFMPNEGDVSTPWNESWTMIAALAAAVPRLRVGPLVSGNTYRHPAVLAKMAATIDHVSGGRVVLGLGAGWQENEHRAYGIEFSTVGGRLARLDEACQVIKGLFTQPRTTFQGKYYQLTDAPLEPKPAQQPLPLLVGGGGEKVTLRIAAKYADEWNVWGDPATLRHKMEVLDRHCESLGRDPEVDQALGAGAALPERRRRLPRQGQEPPRLLPDDGGRRRRDPRRDRGLRRGRRRRADHSRLQPRAAPAQARGARPFHRGGRAGRGVKEEHHAYEIDVPSSGRRAGGLRAAGERRAADTASHRFQELAPGVHFATGAGPVFPLSNALVIVDEADVTVVDSHVTPAAARALIASVATLTPKPITTVINTHYHFDHAHGNHGVSRPASPSSATSSPARSSPATRSTSGPTSSSPSCSPTTRRR